MTFGIVTKDSQLWLHYMDSIHPVHKSTNKSMAEMSGFELTYLSTGVQQISSDEHVLTAECVTQSSLRIISPEAENGECEWDDHAQ